MIYSQQDNKEERQVLGNLLRSQSRSVKVLRDIENKQERKPRANRASRSKKPPGLDDSPQPTTGEVLLDAIPPLPGRENLSTYPSLNTSPPLKTSPPLNAYSPGNSDNVDLWAKSSKEAPQQNSNFDCMQGSLVSSFDFERSLGSLYPMWRERAPEHVEVLVSQWTQPSHEPTQPVRDPATTQKDYRISGDAEYLLETKQIEDENAALGKLEGETRASSAKAEERLRKIEDRLKKRENGWLEIDDKALARLMDETKSLRMVLESNKILLESYASSREHATHRVEAATESFYARRQAKEEGKKKSNQPSADNVYCRQPSNNRLNDYETFIERRNLIGSDSDTDSDTDSEPDIEESTSQNGNYYDEKEVVVVVPDTMKSPARMPDESDFIINHKPLDAEDDSLSSKPSEADDPSHSLYPLHFNHESSTPPPASRTNTATSSKDFGPSKSPSLPPQLIPGHKISTASSGANAAHGFCADQHSSLPPHVRQGSSVSIPSSESSTARSSSTTVVGDSPQSPKSSVFSLGSTTSLASELNNTATSSKIFHDPCASSPETCNPPTCNRKAWKPPQPFLNGYNTFSHVLGTAKHVCLWFKASQDAYTFYLGDRETSFYTLHLVPDDLSTYDTSRVEWTVIEKPWATAKTLRAMNLVYMEDAVGFVWIRKELNWVSPLAPQVSFTRNTYPMVFPRCRFSSRLNFLTKKKKISIQHQIKQLFDFSCVLLDNAINESARDIMQRRSEDAKKLSSLEKSFMSLRRDEKKAQSMSMYEQHRVFFFLDSHHQQSNSKQSRFLRSSS